MKSVPQLWVKEIGTARDIAVAVVRGNTYAEALPAFSAFLVDRIGQLWVRGAHWQDAIGAGSLTDMPVVPSQWSVLDRNGRWLGEVEMPSHFGPREIGADYVAVKRGAMARGRSSSTRSKAPRRKGTRRLGCPRSCQTAHELL